MRTLALFLLGLLLAYIGVTAWSNWWHAALGL